MQLSCPVCNYATSRAHRALKLEVCPRCRADGHEVYLTDAAEQPRHARRRIHAVTGLARAAERMRSGEIEPST
jgi:hypothetical protein